MGGGGGGGLRLRGRGPGGRFQERLQQPLLAVGQRLQSPCRRLQIGWSPMGAGQKRLGAELTVIPEGGGGQPLQAQASAGMAEPCSQ